jgi:hypothetical protein
VLESADSRALKALGPQGHEGSSPSSGTHLARPLTSAFADRDHRWSALGPCQISERLAAGVLQAAGERVQLIREQVPVDVQGDELIAATVPS